MVNIIDLGIGNIKSIKDWVEKANMPAKRVTKFKEIDCDTLIIPGVGCAGPFMEKLKKSGFDKAIIEHVYSGKKIIGICLGFQILADHSEENGGVHGLGLIKGNVEKLGISLTHNGWENFYFDKKKLKTKNLRELSISGAKRIIEGRVFYNHEYGFRVAEKGNLSIPISHEHKKYIGFFIKKGIIGIQFHPEKSQATGFEISRMFL